MTPKTKILHSIPRIICIAAILFVSIFALDAFEEGKSIVEQITAFLIHLIPSFVLIVFLIIAWKRELIGGIIFFAVALILTPIVFTHNLNANHSVWMSIGIISSITIPFLIVGIMFIISHYYKKKLTH
ncbi:MAG: hypothetical protein DRI94_08735 [Bacteroidetes bacterium]|nr:MAG: hypothetical protein DRI94_08735 [Bacteroidota bacterium]